MPLPQVPVLIVAGFLGAGKTSLLNHLLRNRLGIRIGVIVNDFGAINIDAMLIAGQVDSMVSLGNGCMCCSVDTDGLDAMLARLAQPSADIDVIVIEASGLAEPRNLVRLVLAAAAERIRYGGLIEVVDGAEFADTRDHHPEIAQHLRIADLVVLNKIDRLDRAADSLTDIVRGLTSGAPVIPAEHGRLDPALLFDARRRPDRRAPYQMSLDELWALTEDEHSDGNNTDTADHAGHLHAGYDALDFSTDRPMHPRRLAEFLEEQSAGLYRIKGFVYFGLPAHRQKFLLQTVGRFVRYERRRWEPDEPRRTGLVVIGAGFDADLVRDRLAACTVGDTSEVDENAMLAVLRHLGDA